MTNNGADDGEQAERQRRCVVAFDGMLMAGGVSGAAALALDYAGECMGSGQRRQRYYGAESNNGVLIPVVCRMSVAD